MLPYFFSHLVYTQIHFLFNLRSEKSQSSMKVKMKKSTIKYWYWFTHQFTNKGNRSPLTEVWHAVNAKRCVSTVNTHKLTNIKMLWSIFKYRKPRRKHGIRYSLSHSHIHTKKRFTDPGLAHGCLLGSPSWSRLWNRMSKVKYLKADRIYWFHGTGTCTRAQSWEKQERRKNRSESLGLNWVGWVSALHAKDGISINYIVPVHVWAATPCKVIT